jgi:hypothetical protein
MINLSIQKETQIRHTMEPLWKPQVLSNGFTVKNLGDGKLSNTQAPRMSPKYPIHHHPVRPEVGERVPLEPGE